MTRCPYKPTPRPDTIRTTATILLADRLSLKIMTEPSSPNTGTNNDNGATVDTGYRFRSEFHTH